MCIHTINNKIMNEDIYDKVSGLRGDKVGEVRA